MAAPTNQVLVKPRYEAPKPHKKIHKKTQNIEEKHKKIFRILETVRGAFGYVSDLV